MHDLSLYLLELLENSVRAEAAHIAVGFEADQAADRLRLTVDDDGTGLKIDPGEVLDPFYTTKKGKKTGLGLSLLKADAEAAGGYLTIGPAPGGRGVRVEAVLRLSHIDRPPIGDIGSSVMVMEVTHPETRFTLDLSGDRFEPPVTGATFAEVRQQLARVIEQLDATGIGDRLDLNGIDRPGGDDRQENDVPQNHDEPEYAATQPAPGNASSKKRG